MYTNNQNKHYEAPSVEIIEMENESVLCASTEVFSILSDEGYEELPW